MPHATDPHKQREPRDMPSQHASASSGRTPPEPIAIVGLACRFPGGVSSLDDLRSLLAEKRSAIAEVPPGRWDSQAFFHPDFQKLGRIHATRGGWLDNIDLFDAEFFGIASNEASRMDPQQRLLLETAFEAFEDPTVRGIPGERPGSARRHLRQRGIAPLAV